MPREGHGSRNPEIGVEIGSATSCPARGMGVEITFKKPGDDQWKSCPARGMGVEICDTLYACTLFLVMPREGHGSRNVSKV